MNSNVSKVFYIYSANIHLEAPSELLVDYVTFCWILQKWMGASSMRTRSMSGRRHEWGIVARKFHNLKLLESVWVIYVTEDSETFTE